MDSNLLAEKDNSILGKIKRFFQNIFSKNKVEKNYQEEVKIEEETKDINEEKTFHGDLKGETTEDDLNEMKKEEFLNNLEKHPELLYELPIEKLKKIEEYSEELLKQDEEKLEKLKKQNEN